MAVVVRAMNLSAEHEDLLAVLGRNLRDLPHARRFKWLYYDNPAGSAWSWLAYEKETGSTVGVASVFPRSMWLGNEVKRCGQIGDFAIDRGYRSLGPALMLQRATFTPVNHGLLALCYDCPPHDQGMATFRRLGLTANCHMLCYVMLLKTDRYLTKHLGQGPMTTGVAALGNALLNLCSVRKRPMPGLEIALHAGRFDEEFSLLDQKVGGSMGIRGRRAAQDLNWRYRDDPLHEYQVLVARRSGELIAFVVFSICDQDAYLVDLFGLVSLEIGLELIEAVVEHVRKKPVQTLRTLIARENGLAAILEKGGFRFRSQAACVVAYAQPNTEVRAFLDRQSKWSFTHTDILA